VKVKVKVRKNTPVNVTLSLCAITSFRGGPAS